MTYSVDDEWKTFLNKEHIESETGFHSSNIKPPVNNLPQITNSLPLPKCEELYISTKTKVLYLNQPIDIHRIFWLIPITEYWVPTECILKKQMKIVSKTREEYQEYKTRLETIPYYSEHILKQIDNPTARRINFKDERKLTVGLSKKDIMNCRGKIKNAFYNCFAMIVRFRHTDEITNQTEFKEVHVKVFNTGKLEIPGILNTELLDTVKRMILEYIQPHIDTPLLFMEYDKEDNVLINSNFNCGFYIHRERLHTILRSDKYGIESAYDPCSYPGVKCKFYYNHMQSIELPQKGQILPEDRKMKMSELIDTNKYSEISFMIFRTGSVLIVGNCSEKILRVVFDYIKQVLTVEFMNIQVINEIQNIKLKNKKIRKKTISLTTEYYLTISGNIPNK